jgi:hypothetical protein
MKRVALAAIVSWLFVPISTPKTPDGKAVALLLAGTPSHGPGAHEYNAGVLLLAKCLAQGAPNLVVRTYLNGNWPSSGDLTSMDTILFYCDGGEGHMLLKDGRLAQIAKEMSRGAGFVALHYAVEFPADQGGRQALQWMGGFFEVYWSVNPVWKANYADLPRHPVTEGVRPFSSVDEWYFHIRFDDGGGRLTPILVDVPPAGTMSRPDGKYSGNPAVRAEVASGKAQITAWAFERKEGGRGFGFTGGHYHSGWANRDQRKLVLNAILWTAGVEVPAGGVESTVTADDLAANLDRKPAAKLEPPNPAPANRSTP